ncbi:MAG: AsnC family transcriptional regulator [Deltaproteobacteria bacterium]|nr:AsnC family transcriptional regulator [Deltaproteobacteria bacterium]
MDKIDRDIINKIQSDFPITRRPFQEIGEHLDISEEEVIDRLEKLKTEGVIRRIGGNFNSRELGYTSTLCAAKVPSEKIDDFVQVVNSYLGVTHNYQRSHDYNLWFTFIAPDMDFINDALEDIRKKTGIEAILNLPAKRMFKIKVDFEV